MSTATVTSARVRLIASALLLGFAARLTAANIDFEYCTTCHGANGNGNAAIHAPRIAGLEPWYLKSQLQAFRAGWRGVHPDDAPGNEMRPIGVGLTDAEMTQAIAYVGHFTPQVPPVTVSGDVARGQGLFTTCAACHGAHAEGDQAVHAPALAARTDWYLATELKNYRAGLRGANPDDVNGRQMRAAAAALPDDAAIADVVSYIDTLR